MSWSFQHFFLYQIITQLQKNINVLSFVYKGVGVAVPCCAANVVGLWCVVFALWSWIEVNTVSALARCLDPLTPICVSMYVRWWWWWWRRSKQPWITKYWFKAANYSFVFTGKGSKGEKLAFWHLPSGSVLLSLMWTRLCLYPVPVPGMHLVK